MRILQIGNGYVGSYLAPRLVARGHDVVVCDAHPPPGDESTGTSRLHCRYQDLRTSDLEDADLILWFAGHSSVPRSLDDPLGALHNNCLDLLQFAQRKPVDVPMIYASTASVYSIDHRPGDDPPPMLDEHETRLNPVNPYDSSKVAFDALAACFTDGLTGLRLGTVCGWSPQLRPELLFNAMNISAARDGRVRVGNGHAWRAILFLEDLAHVVVGLVETDGPRPPMMNVASMNVAIGDLGQRIADHHGVHVERLADTPTYSFRMDCTLAQELCGDFPEVDLADRCRAFGADIERSGLAVAEPS